MGGVGKIKLDISALGVAILSAWSDASSVTTLEWDSRFSSYNIVRGTSRSCPHVSAVAAYVKTFHPHWSPVAIKFALMTTGLFCLEFLRYMWPALKSNVNENIFLCDTKEGFVVQFSNMKDFVYEDAKDALLWSTLEDIYAL